MTWLVHKFGGSSLGSTDRIRAVANLIVNLHETQTNIAVVLSAMEGVTDMLIELCASATSGNINDDLLEIIIDRHEKVATILLEEVDLRGAIVEEIRNDGDNIRQLLTGLSLSRSGNKPIQDVVSGFGELWLSKIMSHLLSQAGIAAYWMDSREAIFINQTSESFDIDWKRSSVTRQEQATVLVFPGFVASTTDGRRTTLGRNGSDLSAAIISVLLKAEELHIWTDVDGIFSADPRIVDDVRVLDHLTYLEALEMSYFGAQILHPKSIIPVINHNIPVVVRNTFNPSVNGTRVSLVDPKNSSRYMVKGFASIDPVALVTIEGAGMIGVPGISETLFRALHSRKISVIMISQASSEFSISIAVNNEDGLSAKIAVEEEFDILLARGSIRGIKLEENCAILSVVGDNMVNQPGIASTLFSALSRSRINVRMISQGSSERNISVIVDRKDITKGLNAAHSAFYLSHVTVSIGIVGTGLIGSSLLKQIFNAQENLRETFNIDLQINGVMNSRQMILKRGIQADDVSKIEEGEEADITRLVDFIQRDSIPHSLIIDCTASASVSELYLNWLERGIHVITPNKRANSAKTSFYRKLRNYIDKGPTTNPIKKSTYFFYESTVGAGLPIIQTLQDLIKTGDKVRKIEGIFSGTLSYIFNSMTPSDKFSEIVKTAKSKGYTEPDPRDDLSGMDVARKLIILAREVGMTIDLDDVVVESLIPSEIDSSLTINEFLDELGTYDTLMTKRLQEAEAGNKVLRYVGTISDKGCHVGIEALPSTHPFSHLNGSENIISFTTDRYNSYPLIVRGPGAGAEVTSAGVFADILRLVERLGNA